MSTEKFLMKNLADNWRGTHQVFLKPNQKAIEGNFELTISKHLVDKVLEMKYSQIIDQKEYFGIFLISFLSETECEAAWIDEYHTILGVMKFTGNNNSNNLSLEGSYQVGEEFKKWTIQMSLEGEKLRIRHFNHPSNDKKFLGIDIQLTQIK